MSHQIIKQVVEIPLADFEALKESNRQIVEALQAMKSIKRPEFLSSKEFMEEVKISRWKFQELRDANMLRVVQRGRKLYVPATEVTRYFNGEMEQQ